MRDLFDQQASKRQKANAPLADRLRPKTFTEFVGQQEIIAEGNFLRLAIQKDQLPSLIFWGPPGTGKTTLAAIIAKETKSHFTELSAVHSGVKELRGIINEAGDRQKYYHQKTILFIDEIHRWNKAQQDSLLPHVERGIITLIGATTENPSFEVVSPLLSRSRVLVLKTLDGDNLKKIIQRALQDEKYGLGKYNINFDQKALDFLVKYSNGDARKLLNSLEVVVLSVEAGQDGVKKINLKNVEQVLQHRALVYDKGGEEHYNVISAFIKSLRGSDADAGLYYLARMLEAGEDPLFIARRMIILASEDVGNADSQALSLAVVTFQAVQMIGLPEARINLAHCVTYLAKAPKSNASYKGLLAAEEDVQKTLNLSVPLHLRNASTKLMQERGYGKDYKYTHDLPDVEQDFLPEKLKEKKYYISPKNKKKNC